MGKFNHNHYSLARDYINMAHWFHRNPLKATATLNFDLGQASTLARKICGDIRQARAQLLDIFPNPSHDVAAVKAATERYISYLEGFITAVDMEEDPHPQTSQQPVQDTAAGQDDTRLQESSDGGASRSNGDSKLRNSLKVTWTNSLGGKNMFQYDFIFEEINMLLNVALWFTKHAAKLAGSSDEISEDDAKEVHRSLREAAGIFKYIQDNMLNKLYELPGDGSDLDQRILSAYELQCKAEAQEVTIARAIELKHSTSLIASLAVETSKLFTKADDTLKSLEEQMVMKWRKYFQFKSAFYLSYTSEQLAKEYAKIKGPGTVARPQQHPFFMRLGPIVHRILEKTERENGMIYHEKVPDEVPEVESKVTFGLANPVEYKLPARNPEWSPAVYNSFIIKQNKKLDDKDDAVKPLKELPVEQTEKHPGNTTGCIVS